MQQVIVTPDLAQRWLTRVGPHFHGNQAKHAAGYATLMRGGYWVHGHVAPIVFDDDDYLIDGICRVTAVTLARVPVRLWVTGGSFACISLDEPDIV